MSLLDSVIIYGYSLADSFNIEILHKLNETLSTDLDITLQDNSEKVVLSLAGLGLKYSNKIKLTVSKFK